MYSTVQCLLQRKNSDLFVIAPKQTVADAVKKLNQHKVGALLVMDHNVLVGILTERDVLTRVVGGHRVAEKTEVADIMSRKVLTVFANTPTSEAMKLMTAHRCRHLPVLEATTGSVAGVISIGDIMCYAIRCLENEVDSLSSYISTGSINPPSPNPDRLFAAE